MSAPPNEVKTPVGGDKKDVKKHFNNRFHNKNVVSGPKPPKFDGDCDDLRGYIFEITGPDKADVFVKTCKSYKNMWERHGTRTMEATYTS